MTEQIAKNAQRRSRAQVFYCNDAEDANEIAEKRKLTINHAIGLDLIIAGAYFIFKGPIG